jgi:chromosome segregation ATPase
MPQPIEPREAENTPVQLARMEGVLNLVADRVSGLITRVDRHEAAIGDLTSRTQSLQEGAKASTEKAEALALALKEAKEAVEATALQEANKAQVAAREKSDRDALGWSPVTKVFAVGAAAAVGVNFYQALRPGG